MLPTASLREGTRQHVAVKKEDLYPLVNGSPQLVPSIVGFLDALGTRDVSEDPHLAQTRLAQLWDAYSSPVVEFVLREAESYAVSRFTDNVVVGAPLVDSDGEPESGMVYVMTAAYQLALTVNGVFVRGALVLGDLWMNSDFVFGNGVTRAYDLESRSSVYPRVILGRELEDLSSWHSSTYYKVPGDSPQSQWLLRAADGWTFLNYLVASQEAADEVSLLGEHREAVIAGLFDNMHKAGVIEKFQWAAEYHNWYCTREQPDRMDLLIEPRPSESLFFALHDDT